MRKAKLFSVILIFALVITAAIPSIAYAAEGGALSMLTRTELDKIDEVVRQNMSEGKIPGLSLVVVSGDEILYSNGYGYADVENKKSVTMDTVFELGSNSKAFTGLAMLKLEKEGLVNFSDPVEKYIPWFEVRYSGQKVTVTVEQVMNHTSGIPFSSIDKIPESDSDTALEDTVRTLVGSGLQTRPGENYSYATINYDILGLIIEITTGHSYEEYISRNILEPIGLRNTYMFSRDASAELARGYKVGFLSARGYDAPVYRGNKPAGYILINGNDAAKWMMTQLGNNSESVFDHELIEKSHEFLKASFANDVSYTAGWFVNGFTGEVFHGGGNPNFSSHIILDTKTGIGVAALTNMGSSPFPMDA